MTTDRAGSATGTKVIELHWLNVKKDFDENFYSLTMASDEHRKASVLRVYPEYTYNDDEGPLENYIQAVAHANECELSYARSVVQQKLDPIFGDGGAGGFQPWIWYLA